LIELETIGVSRSFGGLLAVDRVDLSVRRGELRALIGPNGAGKSTLLNLLAGTLAPSAGSIRLGERDITRAPVHERALLGLGRSFQVVTLFEGLSCRQVLELALQRDVPLRRWTSRAGAAAIRRRAEEALEAAGLSSIADEESTRISHGLQKRLEIALALANEPRVLLLDEPMAGMSADERLALGETLRQVAAKSTIVFVEHDIEMVMSLAQRVTVLHNGAIVCEGTPEEVRSDRVAQDVYLRGGR
jgi:branched-chain amino acid transport system ATP-binding protein